MLFLFHANKVGKKKKKAAFLIQVLQLTCCNTIYIKVHSIHVEWAGLHKIAKWFKVKQLSFVHNQYVNYLVAITAWTAQVENHNGWWRLHVNWLLSYCMSGNTLWREVHCSSQRKQKFHLLRRSISKLIFSLAGEGNKLAASGRARWLGNTGYSPLKKRTSLDVISAIYKPSIFCFSDECNASHTSCLPKHNYQ